MRTLVAVPCMDMMHTRFVSSLLSLKMSGGDEVRFGASSLVYDTRNQLTTYAIENGFDRILWVDSDMTFGPEILAYLNEDLDKGCGIVSGLCFKRKPPCTPVIYDKCGFDQLENGKLDMVYRVYTEYPQDCLFEVAACGFGCVMVDVAVAKDMVSKAGSMLFTPMAGFGEDLSFCLRARMAEHKIWCDSRVKLGHIGEMVFDENYYKGLRNGNS